MIALDTNALLRWLLADILPPEDGPQVAAVGQAVDDAGATVFVTSVVLAELSWLLRTRLRLDRDSTAAVLARLTEDARVQVEHAAALTRALSTFAQGGAGFADHFLGEIGRVVGASSTLTFDRAAGQLPTFTLLQAGV
ncbi:MAG: PIN domain-containing protein [Gemmobacter sp.]